MNKLRASLFSLFSVATFVCSASEQPTTSYNDKQLSVINIIKERDDLLKKKSAQSYTNFVNNAYTLQKSLNYQNSPSLVNNDFRMRMAENLQPIMKQIAFRRLLLSYAHNTHHSLSYRIHYLDIIQTKLRSIHKATVTAEEIGQYVMVTGEIVHSTQPIGNINNSVDKLPQQVYGEIIEEKKQLELFSTLDLDPSKQNKEIISRLEQFIISLHQAGVEKAEKQEPQIAKLTKAMEANNNEFPKRKIPSLIDTITDAQEKELVDQYKQFFKSKATRKTPYIIAGAIAILFAYYCNLHHKLADFIGYK